MNIIAVIVFAIFVTFVIGLSFYLGRKTHSAAGYYAAGGGIHWAVNGISFAGDYLSAASFLGICGMIATFGYDGFLYSIGYLAGWIVALFIVAEPMKRLGKYTFTDALDSKFDSRGIKLSAAISTLVVSIFYLIPQMVGAGVLVEPLLGIPHYIGVIMVGTIVIIIVATAGMTSTTWVQFIKGSMLIVFSFILVVAVCVRGLSTRPETLRGETSYEYQTLTAQEAGGKLILDDVSYTVAEQPVLANGTLAAPDLVKLIKNDKISWWKKIAKQDGKIDLLECQYQLIKADGTKWINGEVASESNKLRPVGNLEKIQGKTGKEADTGSLNPFAFLAHIGDPDSIVKRWGKKSFHDGQETTVFYPILTPGNKVLRPGLKFKVEGTPLDKLDFISLMLALFFGTAALPHILIRYYTVPSASCARKSTIIAIASIGLFYILTLFMGIGAMTSGTLNLLDDNMSAPLLAQSFGTLLFAVISAIAFATVLGTVSGLICAASGAVAHDLLDRFAKLNMSEHTKVKAGKISALVVGVIAIVLGIMFKGMNVSFLVGWAFAVAASANLPSILMLLFWKKTTAKGIVASIMVGAISAVGLILLSPDMYAKYGLPRADALFQINQPAIVSIPLSFIALIVVSLLTQKKAK